MKLLLDEHLSPEIARRLRERGHDVIAVKERAELVTRSDRVHFDAARDQRRAIVTQDVGDFRPLMAQALRSGSRTYGLVCVPAHVPLRRDAIGQIVDELDTLLGQHPGEDDLAETGGEVWLVGVDS